jgi:hypothetical protein
MLREVRVVEELMCGKVRKLAVRNFDRMDNRPEQSHVIIMFDQKGCVVIKVSAVPVCI